MDVASITIPAGKYLLSARLTAVSYMGNASIDCAFMVNHATALYGDRLNGSGDGTIAGHDKSTFFGKYSGLGGVLTISCQKNVRCHRLVSGERDSDGGESRDSEIESVVNGNSG